MKEVVVRFIRLIAIITCVIIVYLFGVYIADRLKTASSDAATATVQLRNETDHDPFDRGGWANFYLNGETVCHLGPGTMCTIRVHTDESPTLQATTLYQDGTTDDTPPVVPSGMRNGEIYQYIACNNKTGFNDTFGENCGLFGVSTVPPTY